MADTTAIHLTEDETVWLVGALRRLNAPGDCDLADKIEAMAAATAPPPTTAAQFLARVAELSIAVGTQSGTGAMETAGPIISCLYANPEHLDRFMIEGPELFIDGTFAFENGALSYHAMNGQVLSPAVLRTRKGVQQ